MGNSHLGRTREGGNRLPGPGVDVQSLGPFGGRNAKRRGGQRPRGRKMDDHQLRVIDKLWQTRERKVRWMTLVWPCDVFSGGFWLFFLPFSSQSRSARGRQGGRGLPGSRSVFLKRAERKEW